MKSSSLHFYKGHSIQWFFGEWPFTKLKYQVKFADGSQLWTNSFVIIREQINKRS